MWYLLLYLYLDLLCTGRLWLRIPGLGFLPDRFELFLESELGRVQEEDREGEEMEMVRSGPRPVDDSELGKVKEEGREGD